MLKPFNELTEAEATEIVRDIVRSSNSEDEIQRRLTEAGFHGEGAAIYLPDDAKMFRAMVMVWGPHGEIINV